jgi:hypothetical protein
VLKPSSPATKTRRQMCTSPAPKKTQLQTESPVMKPSSPAKKTRLQMESPVLKPSTAKKTQLKMSTESPAQKKNSVKAVALQKKTTGKAVLLDGTKKGDSSITSSVNKDKVQHKLTSSMSCGITNVDHIIPSSDQDVLNRHFTTLATVGAVQPTEAEL